MSSTSIRRCSSLIVIAAALASGAAVQTTLFVAPDGGGAAFTETNPGSLADAQARVRTLTPTMTGDIVIMLKGGLYKIDATITLGPADGGRNTSYVAYQAMPGKTPVFTGGVQIQGLGYNSTKTGVYANAADMPSIANVTDLEYLPQSFAFGAPQWWAHRFIVTSITTEGTRKLLLMQLPYFTRTLGHHDGNERGNLKFWLENAMELCDQPGEWYFNKAAKVVYYYPLPGEDINQCCVFAPKLQDRMLYIRGNSTSNKVRNLKFLGVAFQHVAWNELNRTGGDCRWQSQKRYTLSGEASSTPGGVELTNVYDVTFERCRFEEMGGAGFNVQGGCEKVSVIGSIFRDCSDSPIIVSNPDFQGQQADGGVVPKQILFNNNYITRGALEYWGNALVTGYYCNNLVCTHNDLVDGTWAAFAIGWGWGAGGQAAKNNLIAYNRVDSILHHCGDGGGIYRLSPQSGSVCRENWFRNCKYFRGGLYCDQGSAYWTDKKNVIDKTSEYWFFSWSRDAHDILVDSNWYNSGGLSAVGATVTPNNWKIAGDAWPAAAKAVIDNAGIEPVYRDIRDRIVLSPCQADGSGVASPDRAFASKRTVTGITVKRAGSVIVFVAPGLWNRLFVYDLGGRMVLTRSGVFRDAVECPRLSAGMYAALLQGDDGASIRRFSAGR